MRSTINLPGHAKDAFATRRESTRTGVGYRLYLLFVLSWFLHLGSRIPMLGVVRLDLLLVVALAWIAITKSADQKRSKIGVDRWLTTLIVVSFLSIPLVEWPGSVIRSGFPEFVKACVFFYFTVAFVKSERELKGFIGMFLACQMFRILEPLYLHITEDYWGSFATMENYETLDRLSGAPYDVVNPNGLAYLVCTVLPFFYFLFPNLSKLGRLAVLAFAPASIYVLILTGSRTGVLAFAVIYVGLIIKARMSTRMILVLIGALTVSVGFPLLKPDVQDRYLSIVGLGPKNQTTADGRSEGVKDNFRVALRHPVFGHGLGTSREANANFGKEDQPAHNLYAEVAQELGFVGLLIFLIFMASVFSAFALCRRAFSRSGGTSFDRSLVDALQIWLVMNFLFSFASYGLNSYEWYLMGGLAVALMRHAEQSGQLAKAT